MRLFFVLVGALLVAGCTSNTSSGKWREVEPDTKAGRLERAKTICNGRAGETQVIAGRYWIAGTIASGNTFKACMAEQGFVQ
ncbi:UNVERIFIED_ORG: putative small secreted protein [Rhizobium esperanzae]